MNFLVLQLVIGMSFSLIPVAYAQEESSEVKQLNERVQQLYQAGKYADAILAARRAIELSEKEHGSESAKVATTLNNLAVLYVAMGEHAKAEALLQRALAIRERALGPEHPDVAQSLNNLAMLYRGIGKNAKAEPLVREALNIWEKSLGLDHPKVAIVTSNLALLYQDLGNYEQAEPLFHRALSILEKALGLNHPDVATGLNNLAGLHQATGNYAKAEPLMKRALAIRERALGPEHPDVAVTLDNLGTLYGESGRFTNAETSMKRALAIREKMLGPEHPDVALSLNNLAELYHANNQIAKTQPFIQRALAIREKMLGPEHPDVAQSLDTFAVLYVAMGEHAKGEALLQRALAIRERTLGPEHPGVAQSLNYLAVLYYHGGQYAKAEPLMKRALAIRERALGPEHPDVAQSLNNLAVLYVAMGEHGKGEALLRRALTVRERTLGPEHPTVASTLNSLGMIYNETGQYAQAEPLLQRALAVNEKALGPVHPMVALTFINLAGLADRRQEYSRASELFKRSLHVDDHQIQEVFSFTSEEQKLQFMEKIQGDYFIYLSRIHRHLNENPEAVRDALELVLRRKGVVLDAQSRAREVLKGRLSETAKKDFDDLSALRSDLARLMLNKPEKMSSDLYKEKLNSLQQEIEATERRLASESALVAKELQQRTVTVEGVSKHLPKNTALVEFVKIRDFDFAKGQWKPSWRYLAFVLNSAGAVTLVDLGEANAVDALAQRVSEALRISVKTEGRHPRHAQQSLKSLSELYSQLWVPLQRSLGPADKVLLSPDSVLNLVPFAALMDSNGKPLVERYELAYVSSGRELIAAEGTEYQPQSDLVLVANPAFDLKPESAFARADDRSSLRSRDFHGRFAALPATEREAKEIPPLVAGDVKRKQVVVGVKATESAVKAARGPRILHLATHGFFLQDEDLQPDFDMRGGFLRTSLSAETRLPTRRYENPLLRSGLALAGANHAARVTEGDDGLLTALEITGMDLYGTDFVVLSACETAVGDVKTGEGVFGMRRAFALAGAKNLLMSLWPVNDETTANQMKAFYQNLQILPPAEALRQAQLETIQQLQANYNGIAPPALWAPFILQGPQALGR